MIRSRHFTSAVLIAACLSALSACKATHVQRSDDSFDAIVAVAAHEPPWGPRERFGDRGTQPANGKVEARARLGAAAGVGKEDQTTDA